jgi:hypothetical protein
MTWHRLASTFLAVLCAIGLPSCGHDQQLVSIDIQPASETFGAANIPVSANAGAQVQLRAIGTYIHPPVSKDITSQAAWASNTPDMVTVTSAGLITATGDSCGNTLISATVTTNQSAGDLSSKGAIVTASMTANVVCFTGSGPTLAVNFSGLGSGTVTSSPGGVNCTASCGTVFVTGTSVVLTATPANGSAFGGWGGCDSVSLQVCTVNDLTADRSVTVIFN